MTGPSSVTRRETATPAVPHAATVIVTGWASPAGECPSVAGLPVRGLDECWRGRRVRATLYPGPTRLQVTELDVARVRVARGNEPNGARFQVTGHLIRAERGAQLLFIEVYPQLRRVGRFRVETYGTAQVMRACDPGWTGVSVTGSLLGRALLAETVTPAYAPVAAHWGQARRRRKP